MKLSDYHLHSEYSFDSREKINNLCKKALQEGIAEIVITDHLEIQDRKSYPDFGRRKKEIQHFNEKYKNKLIIKSGVEIGQPHYDLSSVQHMIKENDFDFILASVHHVKALGAPSKYQFSESNTDQYVEKYLKELEEIATDADYDVLAHVSLPFRYIPDELRDIFEVRKYEDQYRRVFRAVINRNKGIEINASGIRTDLKKTLPSVEILKWYEDEGGEIVTIGSDGHSAKSAFLCLHDALNTLKQTKIGKIAHYTKRILSYEEI